MTKKELLDKSLPKWPALIVKGKPVTKDQAKEIIVRTDRFGFSSNDAEFVREIYELVYGLKQDKLIYHVSIYDYFDDDDKLNAVGELRDKIFTKYGKLNDIEFLNNHMIVSSWIGGPHGWCDWNGHIGCNNYNIGKYPTIEEVYDEWKLIAKTFPFLDLKSQLLDGEACEDNVNPVVEFIVKNGKVKIKSPSEILDYSNFNIENVLSNFLSPNSERGCTIEQLKNALEYCENKCKNNINQIIAQ